jgi:hypothetical protein
MTQRWRFMLTRLRHIRWSRRSKLLNAELSPCPRWSAEGFAMERNEDTVICPVCGKAMSLLTIRKRHPDEETLVLQCWGCGVSTTKTREAPAGTS